MRRRNGVSGSQGWEKRQQDLGRGTNKPHHRVYKVAFLTLGGGVTWSLEGRLLNFPFQVGHFHKT